MSPHVLTFLPAAGPAAGKSMWMAVDRVMLKELKGLVPAWLFFFFSSFAFLFFYHSATLKPDASGSQWWSSEKLFLLLCFYGRDLSA